MSLKFLVENRHAGTLIGKAGATINQIQTLTQAKIKVSQQSETFPGTSDRVVLVTGQLSAVLLAQAQMLARIVEEIAKESGSLLAGSVPLAPPAAVKLRVLIPSAAAGGVIGRAGANIKLLSESTGARIQLASKEQSPPGANCFPPL